MTDERQVIYELDDQDRIRAVGGAWNDFLDENIDGPEQHDQLCEEAVVGHPLDQYVHDERTLMYLKTVLGSVRHLNRARTVPYRCDAPAEKRFMEMMIEPVPVKSLRLTHRIVKTEPLVPAFPVQDVGESADAEGLRCSICNRVEVRGAWVEPDAAALADHKGTFLARHTVCPVCRAALGARD